MNLLYKIYFALPNFSGLGVAGRAINHGNLRILKFFLDMHVPSYLKKTAHKVGMGINTEPREEKYIVSLTSFPARINDIWISIETVMRQTFKPDMIILWLADEQFPDRKLPQSLLDLEKRGLTIRFCENLRSHTKYYFTFKEYPDATVITVDDDCYYPKDILENLVKMHKKYPEAICANRAHKITFTADNKLKPYRKWIHNYKGILSPDRLLVATGVSGVLYPPHSLSETIFDKEVFKKICFFADDLWLKVNTDLKGTQVVTTTKFNKDLVAVSKTQNERLVSQNSFGGGNDEQFQNVIKHFNFDAINYYGRKH